MDENDFAERLLQEEQVAVVPGSAFGESGKGFQGLEGKIMDETKNTFVLETVKGRKTVPKKECVFFFPARGVRAEGELLVSRPEDRTKKIARLSARR